MAEDDELPYFPAEIPWQLAATTRHLGPKTLGPDTTAISLFTYVPTLETLDADYPDDRLIYFKFTVSVSPIFPFGSPLPFLDPLGLFTADPFPIWRLLFDVRISPEPYVAGGMRPYFLSAAPIRRAMLETGVVGQQTSEGEAKSLAIGKSGAQMHEGFSSTVDTSTNSAGVSWPFGGVSASGTSTEVSGSRDVVQHIDSTQRNASTERQELVSHMTNVTNVLSLLNTFDVGSPYLRFSLWSRPLQPLVVDPSDSNLWYAELLRRRSSGIEGIQEFYAVAAVPRSLERFCVEMQLRRFSAVPPPLPGSAQLAMSEVSLYPTDAQVAILETHLGNRYPTGTPVDELDVELVYFPNNTKIVRPVVADWVVFPVSATQNNDSVSVATLDTQNLKAGTQAATIWAIYKTAIEAWLDMKKEEFETALLQSPLVNGKLFFRYLKLNTCFGPPLASLAVVDTMTISPKKPSFLNLAARPPMQTRPTSRKSDLYRQAVFAWNAAEQQIGQAILHATALPETEMRFDESKLAEFALRDLAGLDPGDPRNRRLRDAPEVFGLTASRIRTLERQGIADLRSLAEAIGLASVVEQVNRRREGLKATQAHAAGTPTSFDPPAPVSVVLGVPEADALKLAFGAYLQVRAEEAWETQAEN